MRVITLNVNGIRSAVSKGLLGWLSRQKADLVCLQEIRAHKADLPSELVRQRSWQVHLYASERKGYGGVAVLCRRSPDRIVTGLGWADVDCEGRYLQVDFGPLSIASLYVPSGTTGPERQAFKMDVLGRLAGHLSKLARSGREYVLCGDLNIAHQKIDIENWRGNQKNSGFLPEERAWLDELFGPRAWVDAFRVVTQEPRQYTWWSNRGRAWENNVGWRIDYQIATPGVGRLVRSATIYRAKRFSDHAPLIIDYDREL